MRLISLFVRPLVIFVLLAVCIFSCDKSEDRKTRSKSEQSYIELSEEFHGWDSLILRNAFIRLDVVPELGGKIMGYDSFGVQILWHNPAREGEVEIFQQNDLGQDFINAGGAKVWPAPQGEWGGPPDKILDGAPYTSTFDGKIITVTSPEDDGADRTGIQYMHSYSLRPSSTIVNLNLSMTNIIDSSTEWALWHLATVPVDRDFTVYVPVDEGNWNVMNGDENNPQWLGVEEGLFRARYENFVGKVGMKVREGWAVWHDEENDVAFTMLFPIQENSEYPHGGHNFEIWTNNPETAYMELEVLGPLTNLNPGESSSLDVTWGVCRCSDVKRVLPIGVISEELKIDDEHIITGKFGVFYGGKLEEFQVDKDGNRKGYERFMDVSPLSEITLRREPAISRDTTAIRYQVIGYDNNLIGIIGEVKVR